MRERTSERRANSALIDAVEPQPLTKGISTPPPAPANVRRPRSGFLRRVFWLDERIGNVESAGRAAVESGWLEFEAAREAREALWRLSELSPSNIAVLTLRRSEVLGLIHATMRRHGVDYASEDLTAQDWANAASIDEIRNLRSRLTDRQSASLEAALAEGGQSYLIHLDAAGRRRAARTLGRTAQHLIGSFASDREKIERLRFQRWLRIGPALLTLVALLGLGARWLGNHRQQDNLAFHRPVIASSTLDVAYRSSDRLVDGNVSNVGFHTTPEDPNPWAMVDLGSSKRFSRVVMYNRADCCQERQVPMVLEVSADGVRFERLAERQVKFDKWTVQGLRATGRYVRFRLEGTGMFHLAEVAIYE